MRVVQFSPEEAEPNMFSLESFTAAHADAMERAFWVALQRLNEQRVLQEHLAKETKDKGLKKRFQENAAAAAIDIRLLHEILARL